MFIIYSLPACNSYPEKARSIINFRPPLEIEEEQLPLFAPNHAIGQHTLIPTQKVVNTDKSVVQIYYFITILLFTGLKAETDSVSWGILTFLQV